ncbi:MAG: hypothetical protein AAFR38_14315 [Planctomycetota bacterium]
MTRLIAVVALSLGSTALSQVVYDVRYDGEEVALGDATVGDLASLPRTTPSEFTYGEPPEIVDGAPFGFEGRCLKFERGGGRYEYDQALFAVQSGQVVPGSEKFRRIGISLDLLVESGRARLLLDERGAASGGRGSLYLDFYEDGRIFAATQSGAELRGAENEIRTRGDSRFKVVLIHDLTRGSLRLIVGRRSFETFRDLDALGGLRISTGADSRAFVDNVEIRVLTRSR